MLTFLYYYIVSIEFLGTSCGIMSVLLLGRGNPFGFVVGLINTFIYVYLDFHKAVYGQILVNLYYTFMDIWGWILWRKKNERKQNILLYSYTNTEEKIKVVVMLFIFFMVLLDMNLVLQYCGLMRRATTPYLDSMITALIFTAMYLSVGKKIEGWYIWLLVNSLAMILFYRNGLYITIIQYLVYFILALLGWRHWVKQYRLQHI